ncbi:ATP-binding protein [Actinomadura atramentaria]|uniref:ATP-binding protein n=1 Tax=Actinomadura atramentaria TaxID=1990 RepID=UPI00037C2C58|nr:ATP-binding protein [Actinomadura atramentaria]
MTGELLRVDVRDEDGVFAVRQAGREVAAAVGLDPQDQVRTATALSELGRELYTAGGRVTVVFRVAVAALTVELAFPPGSDDPWETPGLRAASRLMDAVTQETSGDERVVRIAKNLPPHVRPPDADALRRGLAHLVPTPALEELRTQNAELVDALDEVRRQREELRALNAELEETNRGVMALYNEISAELEETNRGVVALYAELEEKSDQLVEAGETRKRFWATVSHELRTPVNGIIGLARLLLDPAADPLTADQRHQVSLVADAGGTLLSLVNELLDMARAERGALVPDLAPVAVPALLAGLAAQLEPTARESGVALVVDASGAPPELVADEVMLTRVLRNVLANGLKFTAAGEVRLTVRAADGEVVFAVADTGPGIPEDERERVFEEFYRVPGTGVGGSGLGLPYARRLARALGGDLLLDSVVGTGTTVTLRLPAPRDLAALGLGHVLVVDDDPAARRVMRGLVEPAAARIGEAADGAAALALAAADPPDLVLLDLRMPGLDGLAVLAELPPDVPVVLVTSADLRDAADPRLDRAAVLEKDRLGPATLADAVRRALDRRERGTP